MRKVKGLVLVLILAMLFTTAVASAKVESKTFVLDGKQYTVEEFDVKNSDGESMGYLYGGTKFASENAVLGSISVDEGHGNYSNKFYKVDLNKNVTLVEESSIEWQEDKFIFIDAGTNSGSAIYKAAVGFMDTPVLDDLHSAEILNEKDELYLVSYQVSDGDPWSYGVLKSDGTWLIGTGTEYNSTTLKDQHGEYGGFGFGADYISIPYYDDNGDVISVKLFSYETGALEKTITQAEIGTDCSWVKYLGQKDGVTYFLKEKEVSSGQFAVYIGNATDDKELENSAGDNHSPRLGSDVVLKINGEDVLAVVYDNISNPGLTKTVFFGVDGTIKATLDGTLKPNYNQDISKELPMDMLFLIAWTPDGNGASNLDFYDNNYQKIGTMATDEVLADTLSIIYYSENGQHDGKYLIQRMVYNTSAGAYEGRYILLTVGDAPAAAATSNNPPKTGDTADMLAYGALLLVTASGATVYLKKRNSSRA